MSESRQVAAFRNAGFFAIQLDFARRMAAGRGLALGEAVAAYTCLRRRLSLSEDDPSTKLPWTAYLERLQKLDSPADQEAWTQEVFLDSPPEGLAVGQTPFGCFSCEPPTAQGVLRLHFTNREMDGAVGPLHRERLLARRGELAALFTFVRETWPNASRVYGSSWLYHLEAYRGLFPPAYGAARRTPFGPVRLAGMSSWGQLLDRRGWLKPDVAQLFSENLRQLDLEAPWRAFPRSCLVTEAPIVLFYEFYGIAP